MTAQSDQIGYTHQCRGCMLPFNTPPAVSAPVALGPSSVLPGSEPGTFVVEHGLPAEPPLDERGFRGPHTGSARTYGEVWWIRVGAFWHHATSTELSSVEQAVRSAVWCGPVEPRTEWDDVAAGTADGQMGLVRAALDRCYGRERADRVMSSLEQRLRTKPIWTKAYLCAFLGPLDGEIAFTVVGPQSGEFPTLFQCRALRILSEFPPTSMSGGYVVLIAEDSGRDFAEAHDRLRAQIERYRPELARLIR